MLLLILSLALALLFACSITHLYRISSLIGWIVGIYLLTGAHIVAATQTAGALAMLRPFPVLAIQTACTALALWVWWRIRRRDFPVLIGAVRARMTVGWAERGALVRWMQQYPALTVFALAVIIGLSISLWTGVTSAPTTGDAMRYHLSRVGYWMLNDDLYPFVTNNIRQVTFPVVTSLPFYWILDFARAEWLLAFVQWSALLITVLCIYGCARAAGAARPASLFAALLFPTFSAVIMQAVAPRNDIMITMLGAASLYTLWIGLRDGETGMLLLSGVAIGISLGVRPNLVYAAPGVILGLMVWWWKRRDGFRRLLTWGAACAVCLALLGSYTYIVNLAYFQTVTGSRVAGVQATIDSELWQELRANMARTLFLSLDFSTLPPVIRDPLNEGRNAVFKAFDTTLGLEIESAPQANINRRNGNYIENFPFVIESTYPAPYNEDWGSFGFILPLLVIPAIGRGTVMAIRRRDAYLIMVCAALFSHWVVLCATQLYSNSHMRYLMLSLAFGLILFAAAFPARWTRGIRPGIFAALALYVMFMSLFNHQDRRLVGENTIYQRTRLEQITVNQFWSWLPAARDVEACVPPHGQLGLMYFSHAADYFYFGDGFTRVLVQLVPQYDGTLLPDPESYPELRFIMAENPTTDWVPSHFTPIRISRDYTLYAREDTTVTCEIRPHGQ
jgi:4-amino-4-deoxy-L-arabinose transferase-like glycosyltransferase